ncbi:MAG: hypothetical protein RIT81_34980 [Deltaproteobacteria bacterium]
MRWVAALSVGVVLVGASADAAEPQFSARARALAEIGALLERTCRNAEIDVKDAVRTSIRATTIERMQRGAKNFGAFDRDLRSMARVRVAAQAGDATALEILSKVRRAEALLGDVKPKGPTTIGPLCENGGLTAKPPMRRLVDPAFASMVVRTDTRYAGELAASVAWRLREHHFGAVDLQSLQSEIGADAWRATRRAVPALDLLVAAEAYGSARDAALISLAPALGSVLQQVARAALERLSARLVEQLEGDHMLVLEQHFRDAICVDREEDQRWYPTTCALIRARSPGSSPYTDLLAAALQRDLAELPAALAAVIAHEQLEATELSPNLSNTEREVRESFRLLRSGAVDAGLNTLATVIAPHDSNIECAARVIASIDSPPESDAAAVRRALLAGIASDQKCRARLAVPSQPRRHFADEPPHAKDSTPTEPITLLDHLDRETTALSPELIAAVRRVSALRALAASATTTSALAQLPAASLQATEHVARLRGASDVGLVTAMRRLAGATSASDIVALTSRASAMTRWTNNPGVPDRFSKVIGAASDLIQIADAKDEDELEATVERIAMPRASWRRKQVEQTLSVSLTALVGVHSGGELRWGQRGAIYEGQGLFAPRGEPLLPNVFAPIGIDVTCPSNLFRLFGFFVSLVDVGAYLQYDGDGNFQRPTALTPLSPGAGFRFGFEGTFLTMGALATWRPFQRAPETGVGAPLRHTVQVSAFLAGDLTLWTFSERPTE